LNSLSPESKFEHAIGYVLITGVAISLVLEVIGISIYYLSYGHFRILEGKTVFIHGRNFFYSLLELVRGGLPHQKGLLLMSLGVAVLVLTPYVRVVLSVLHFAQERNVKYVLITLFVLTLLTVSLAAQ
jgi:uncharacterized membrane protein